MKDTHLMFSLKGSSLVENWAEHCRDEAISTIRKTRSDNGFNQSPEERFCGVITDEDLENSSVRGDV